MKALIIGATGATGTELVKQLLADDNYHEVVIFVRKCVDFSHPKLTVYLTDFDDLHKVATHIVGDVLFLALGTTKKQAGTKQNQWKIDHDYQLNFAKIARQNHVHAIALISADGANECSLFFYHRMKGALENELIQLNFCQAIFFRPSLLKRPNSERLGERMGEKLLEFFNHLGLFTNHKPLPTKKLAHAMIKAVSQNKAGIIDKKEIWKLLEHSTDT